MTTLQIRFFLQGTTSSGAMMEFDVYEPRIYFRGGAATIQAALATGDEGHANELLVGALKPTEVAANLMWQFSRK
jgi:hypothetical protein